MGTRAERPIMSEGGVYNSFCEFFNSLKVVLLKTSSEEICLQGFIVFKSTDMYNH